MSFQVYLKTDRDGIFMAVKNKTAKKRRSKGSGSVFRKSNGNYCLQYRDVSGKLKTVTLKDTRGKSITDYEAAIQAAKPQLEEYQKIKHADTREKYTVQIAEYRGIVRNAKIKLANLWDLYKNHPSRPQSRDETLRLYEMKAGRFLRWMSANYPAIEPLAAVTDDIAREYARDLERAKISAKTFNDHVSALRIITRVLMDLGRDEGANPWRESNIKRKAAEHQSRKELSPEQILKVLAVFDKPDFYILYKEEMRTLFNLAAWAALRLKDGALLKWDDVHFEKNRLSLVPSKTRRNQKPVIIPIHPRLLEELRVAEGWRDDSGYVLPRVAARYGINPSGIVHDCAKVFKEAGFETAKDVSSKNSPRKLRASVYGLHSFRHSFVSICAAKNIPMSAVQEIVGHRNPQVTKIYTHVGNESIEKAINALSAPPNGTEPDSRKARIIKLLDSASGAALNKCLKILERQPGIIL
jgi:integrase